MKAKMLARFSFSKKLNEQLVHQVMYNVMDPKVVAKQYDLPHVNTLTNWIKVYKKELETGAITLAPMEKKGKVKAEVSGDRINENHWAQRSNVISTVYKGHQIGHCNSIL